jgi:hydrogenase expression/formation protein HypD
MTSREQKCQPWLVKLRDAASRAGRILQFMEVCGTHTVSAFRCGLHSLMPENVVLLSGPGCPVCVTSAGEIDLMISLGRTPNLTLFTYGDMLRVTGSDRKSLATARSEGADVRIVYSALDAVRFAADNPRRQVAFLAVGFETTTPPTAAAVFQAERLGLKNFSIFASHKRILPAMRALCRSGDVKIDGFLCPGHVSVIVGSQTFWPIVREFHLPCVVVGFEDAQIAEGVACLAELAVKKEQRLENLYPQAVSRYGNRQAQNLIQDIFEPADVSWRGLGKLPDSGLAFRPRYQQFDARHRYGLVEQDVPEPKGCRCGDVITGRCRPIDCRLFSAACTPVNPIGPCMVSSEGTCQAWFKYGQIGGRFASTAEVHA